MGAHNEKREQARLMYLRSKGAKTLLEIAQKLDVPLPTVKSWKQRGKWDDKPEEKPKATRPHRPPVVYGNKNALGNKGPNAVGNTYALRTGAHESIAFSNLTDEERELIKSLPLSPKEMLRREAVIYAVREKRILERIRTLQEEQKSKMVVTRVRVTKVIGKGAADAEPDSEATAASEAVGKGTGTVTTAESENIVIPLASLEKALSDVQNGMRATMIALQRIHNDELALAQIADKNTNEVEDLAPLALLLKGELQDDIRKGRPIRSRSGSDSAQDGSEVDEA